METDSNGHGNGKRYLRFGEPGHEVELSDEHVSALLTIMWTREKPHLAALIGEAYTGVRPAATRASAGGK